MMKMKLNDVLTLNNVVKTLIDMKSFRIDALFKFKLLGIARELAPFAENYQVIFNDKINEYGSEELDEKGNPTGRKEIKKDDAASVEKFNKAIEEFLNSEVDVNIQKLKTDEVFDAGVPADWLIHLFNIIEE